MRKAMKRSLSLLLAITIIFSSAYVGLSEVDFSGLFAVRAKAASVSNLTFKLNPDGESYSVTDCVTSASGELVIPATYNNLPVTRIGDDAFYNCTSLTSITIPDSVTSIGDYAFVYCENLNAVYITDIAKWCGITFASSANPLRNGAKLYLNGELVTNLIIPNSVTSIGDYAFYNCTSLTSITIPDSVTSIGDWAFDNCTSLNAVYITDIASWCGITFSNLHSNPLRYAEKLYLNGELVTDLVIPDGVTSINNYAFYNCTSLTSITIPNSVTSIGAYAFDGCESLKAVYITDIAKWCGITFSNLHSNPLRYANNLYLNGKLVTDLVIPYGVTRIPVYGFSCTSLTSITIPDSVTSIGDYAFDGCESLKAVYITDIAKWCGITFSNLYSNPLRCANNLYLNGKLVTDLVIPYGVTRIPVYGFSCTSLTSITIPDSVTSIRSYAFYYCRSLTSITIPASVTSIGEYAFAYCESLKNVYYKGSEEQWKKISIGSYNNSLTSATMHYIGDNFAINSSMIVTENGTILFSIYNKNAWAELDVINLISPDAHCKINDATIAYNGTTKTLTENYVYIKKADLSKGVTVTASDFQKYVIPSTVTDTWEPGAPLDFSVYMTKDRKDGKTYISTVFARNCSEDDDNQYIDVTSNNLNLLNGVKTDVVVTAVQQDSAVKEYYLSQDEKHKISDADGIFSAVDLYSVFDENKPVYAYAVLKNGNTTEPVSVSLKKQVTSNASATVINALENGNLSFFGKDGFKYTLSDEIPIVGGANITAGIPTIPVGFEMQNERVRISIGADIFKNNINGKDDTEWFSFKDTCKSINDITKSTKDDTKAYDKFMKKNKYTQKDLVDKKKNLNLSFLGYIEGYIIDGELVFKEVCGTAALSFFFNYKQQFLVAGIPAIYAYVKAGGELAGSVSGARPIADSNFPVEFDLAASLTPSVRIGGGVGVKDAISAGIWGQGSMPVGYNFTDTHFTLGLRGELGLEAEFFILKGDVTLLDGSVNLIDHYFNSSKAPLTGQSDALYSGNAVDVFEDGEVSLADRSYLANTSEWLGGQSASPYSLRRTITPESVKISDLQTSVYKNSQTQLVQFGDTMLMAWIEDCANRDDYNRMRLVYSVYDIGTGLWSAPQAVADNGKCDSAPSLATDGENVYIAWQNIDYTVSTADKETVDIIMENAEIRLAKYNPQTNAFENVKTVTNNSTYDYAPKATVNNGIAEVYWVNSASADFQKGTLSILKSDFNGVTGTVLSGLNYVHCVDSNGTEVSYTMDKDGDTSTTTDNKVYTNANQVSVDYDGVDVSCLYSTYAMLDGKKTLFYVDDYNLCYIQNGEEKVVFDSPRSINGNLQVCSDGTKTTAMWLEAGEMGTELYTCTYENGEWSSPVQLTNLSKVLSNVALTYFDGKIYGVFNRTHLEEVTSEVDGSIYYKNGTTDLCQLTTEGFTDISLSLIDIDESLFVPGSDVKFTVLAENNGTEKITNVSFEVTDGNGYAQTIEKTVDLTSGDAEFIELTYTVPETISQTELSVYAIVNADTNESDNTASINIGTPDLEIGELKVQFVEGVYIVSGIVTNNNSVAANDVIVNAYLGEATEDNLITSNIGVIEPHTSAKIEFMIADSVLNFGDSSYYDVTLNVTSSEEERITYNNESVTVISETGIHNHSYSDWVIEKEATCTEEGSKYKECANCGDKVTETITAKGHIYSEVWTVDKAATCTEDGSKSHHCTVCGDKTDVTVIKASGHTASAWIINYESYTKHKECTVCGEVLETHLLGTIVDSGTCGENITWKLDDAGVLTISGTGAMSNYSHNGSSSDSPFRKSNEIKSVVLSNGITSIGKYAFVGCSSLASISIPDSVKSIGYGCFDGCTNLVSINIPYGVTSIADYTFSKCTSLKSIVIPNSVTSIGNYAFSDCANLSSIIIPDSVKYVGIFAFKDTAYYNNSSKWANNVLYIGNHLIEAKDTISGAYSIKNGTKTIGGYAFDECANLTAIAIPDSVVFIGYGAFIDCKNLGSVVIPKNVTNISVATFQRCSKLTSVIIPNSVKSIGQAAFYDCNNLERVTISNNVTYIGEYAFGQCYNLDTVLCTSNKFDVSSKTIDNGNGYLLDATWHYNYDPTKPATPKVTTTNEIGGVNVKWNKVTGAAKYVVFRRQGGYSTWVNVGTTTGTTLLDKTVKSGIYYVYSVRAYNAQGKYSDFVSANTQTRKFMATPKLTTIYNHQSGLAIKWNAVAGVTKGYRVYRRGAGQTTWTYLGTTKNLYFIDSAVKNRNGEYYRYTVIADGGYHSKFDTTGLYLRRLANPTLTSAVSSKSGITVKWGAVKGTTGYYVYRKTANSTWVRVAAVGGTNNTTFLDKTAKKGTTYTYTVRAVYGATTSAYNSGISCYDKY